MLQAAAGHGKGDVVQMLLSHGADIHAVDEEISMISILRPSLEVLKFCLACSSSRCQPFNSKQCTDSLHVNFSTCAAPL